MDQLADNIWIFDGETVPFFSLPFTTRMTVIRLADGTLWVHSPIRLTDLIKDQMDSLGEVKFLIAPNHLHHLFLLEWLDYYKNAVAYGTEEVIKKRSDISFFGSLNQLDSYACAWHGDVTQEMFTGSVLMEECVFFHKHSKTLIVADLVENFSGTQFSYWQRLVAKYVGILAPHGKMPLDWRLSFTFKKAIARQHFKTIMSWHPERLVMAHGEIVSNDAQQFLDQSFSWLK